MIAALVFIALAATAQAYPGSDKALAVSERDVLGARLGDNVLCLIKYIEPVQAIVKRAAGEVEPLKTLAAGLVAEVKACEGNVLQKITCDLQAVRDTWEGSEEVRGDALALYNDALALGLKIKNDCFKSE